MIPRTKVNYRFRDLLIAVFISDRKTVWRGRLIQALAELFGTKQLLLTASGRGALYLLFRTLPHTKVLIPAYTCKAVVEAAHLANKTLLYADCEDGAFNMDATLAIDKMDPDVIVIATHQFGIPCAISKLVEAARTKGAYVVEDVAAGLGTRIDGRLAGTFGDAAIFSFDTTKLINIPLKAGFLLVSNTQLFKRCQTIQNSETRPMPLRRKIINLILGLALVVLKNHVLYRIFHTLKFRWRNKFTDDRPIMDTELSYFYTYRMPEWQAYIAFRQIIHLDSMIATRQRIYSTYIHKLTGTNAFKLPPEDAMNEWACIRFPVQIPHDKLRFYQKGCREGMDFAFSFTYILAPKECSRAHQVAGQILNLPFYIQLSEKEQEKVILIINKITQQ